MMNQLHSPSYTLFTPNSLPFGFPQEKRLSGTDEAIPSDSSTTRCPFHWLEKPIRHHSSQDEGEPLVGETKAGWSLVQKNVPVWLKKGKETERIGISILSDQPHYRIAIRTLNHHRFQPCLSCFWKPQTLKAANGSELTILINMNSAVKRLAPLSLSREQVIEALENNQLLHSIFLKAVELFISDHYPALNSLKIPLVNLLDKFLGAKLMKERDIAKIVQQIQEAQLKANKKIHFGANTGYLNIFEWLNSTLAEIVFMKENSGFSEMSFDQPEIATLFPPKNILDIKKKILKKTLLEKECFSIDPDVVFERLENIRKFSKSSYSEIIDSLLEHQHRLLEQQQKISQHYNPHPLNKILNTSIILQHYTLMTGCAAEKAHSILSHLINRWGISRYAIKKMLNVLQTVLMTPLNNHPHSQSPIKLKKKEHKLPCSLQYHPFDRSFFLLLKNTEPVTGVCKTAKLAVDMKTGHSFIRIIHPFDNEIQRERAYAEFKIMEELSGHPAVPFLLPATLMERRLGSEKKSIGKYSYMVERYEGGDLGSLINEMLENPDSRQKDRQFIALSLFEHLVWLHDKKKRMHLDLKPENIVYRKKPKEDDDDEIEKIALIDFALSCQESDLAMRKRAIGTIDYLPPEKIKALRTQQQEAIICSNSFPADIWSAGMVLYFLFYFDVPSWFDKENVQEKMRDIENLKENWLPESHTDIQQLVRKLLNIDPQKRPTAADTLNELQRIFSNHSSS